MSDQTRPLTDFDRQCILAFQTWDQLGRPEDPAVAANALDIPRHTFSNRLLKFFLRDLGGRLPGIVLPGHEIVERSQRFNAAGEPVGQTVKTRIATSDEPFRVPEGHRIKGVSAFLGPDGSVRGQWLKSEEIKGKDEEAIIESIRLAAVEVEQTAQRARREMQAPRLEPPAAEVRAHMMNLHVLADLHLGLYVWGEHCGENWNLGKAIEVIKGAMLDLMQRAPAARQGVILGGGDLIHADDDTKQTRRAGHVLDVDGRYPRVLKEAELLLVYQVELALEKYDEVVVRILPGNHDDDSSVAVPHFLWAWFRNEPRVRVDMDPGPFFWHQWGRVMLGATHGHLTKIENLKDVATADQPEMWGQTTHRYGHGFHYHSRQSGEKGGMAWEVHRTPIPRDAYAHDHGFRSGRAMQVITYHDETGEDSRTTKNL